jgi:hypothetical protein
MQAQLEDSVFSPRLSELECVQQKFKLEDDHEIPSAICSLALYVYKRSTDPMA